MTSLNPDQVNEILASASSGATFFLVGAGGCGMSGLGHLLLDLGFQVAGSDLALNDEIRQLRDRGARIAIGHSSEHVRSELPVLAVYSSAVRSNNPELTEAAQRRIPIVRRSVLLAALLHRQAGVCVAGMHGKTTTSSLLASALEKLGRAPSYAIGALVPQLERHARFSLPEAAARNGWAGGAPYFVIEADESDGSLREFRPRHAIVLNVDAEHLDFYANLEAICQEFWQFASRVSGHLAFCADDARLAEIFSRRPGSISYGFHPLASYRCERARPASGEASSGSRFTVWHRGQKLGDFSIQLIGEKNISNATAVIAFLHQCGFGPEEIAQSIAGFRGAARRQEELHHGPLCRVFDDYGHHPAEIRATLAAFKALHPRRLLVAFQPHRYTRTQHLLSEFATCFADADFLWLADVYAASEPEIPGVNSQLLAGAVRAQGKSVAYSPNPGEMVRSIRAALEPGDIALFMGAGADITAAARDLAALLDKEALAAPAPAAAIAAKTLMHQEHFAALRAQLSSATVLKSDEPLAKRTTLRVGGKADLLVEPASEEDLAKTLRFCADKSIPFVILGRGSNLLIRDAGIRGAVISLAHPNFSQLEIDGEHLKAGAGVRLKTVAVEARRRGLAGLEFLEGIPGSVGGAMRMNAGAMGSWMFDVIEKIRFMSHTGEVFERAASEVNVEYRGCPLLKNHIALGATLKGAPCPSESIKERMDAYSKKRWESQPNQPSAGCIFKNTLTIPAGKLIDELGLKGAAVGGAMVSNVHANFIVNTGAATATDVLNLIELIRDRARKARGIELETEVEILGDPAAEVIP